MKIFLSHSGKQSVFVAEAFLKLVSNVIQATQPWISSEGIEAGQTWMTEVGKKLEETRYGVLFVNQNNFHKPWILFEAGALAKSISDPATRVCPYLIDMKTSDLPDSPLTQFQAVESTHEGTLKLLQSINNALGDEKLDVDRLKETYEFFWPSFSKSIDESRSLETMPEPTRDVNDVVRETLDVARRIERALAPSDTRYLRYLAAPYFPKSGRVIRHGPPIVDGLTQQLMTKFDVDQSTAEEMLRELAEIIEGSSSES